MEKLIKKIKKGYYNHGIKGYLKDAKLYDITIQDAKGIIIDFLECRNIEKEEEKDYRML